MLRILGSTVEGLNFKEVIVKDKSILMLKYYV